MRSLLLCALLSLAAPLTARAESAVDCHCFTDRTYDPARPASADAYILATTRSSLLSASFGVVKRALVQAVMTGADPDDLFVAHWAGARLDRRATDLLDARKAAGSWKAALDGAAPDRLGKPFSERLAADAPSAALAAIAIDDVLATRAGTPPDALRALRGLGASNGETIVAAVLGPVLKKEPAKLLAPVRARKTTWGALLDGAGIAPAGLDAVVRARVR